MDATTAATVALTGADAGTLLAADLPAHRRTVHDLLTHASALLCTGRVDAAGRPAALGRGRGRDLGAGSPRDLGIDLVGARLAGVDLRSAQLTGRLLIEADLRGADLRGADLRGADLRGAEVSGADLRGALFVVQAQLDAARGDEATTLPAALTRPTHWTAPPTRPAAAQSEATVEHGRRRG